jgi:hypothetical protein
MALRKYGRNAFEWQILGSFGSRKNAFVSEAHFIALLKPEYNVSSGGEGSGGIEAWNRRKVICLDDGIVYDSCTAAGDAYGAHAAEIVANCKGKNRTVQERHFQYFEKNLSEVKRLSTIKKLIEDAAIKRYRVKELKQHNRTITVDGRDAKGRSAAGPMSLQREVVCHEDGKIFPSASAAALAYRICKSSLIEACLGKKGRKTVGGKRFSYLEASI